MNDPFADLKPEKPPIKPQGQILFNRLVHASEIQPRLNHEWLWKWWLGKGGLSVLYGETNVGKSFLGLHIGHHVTKGRKLGGKAVNKGRVFYIAAEGGSVFYNRLVPFDDPEMWILPGPVVLTGRGGQAYPVAEVIQYLETVGGSSFDLIIIDTMSRVMGAGDENTAPGIAELLNSIDHIRSITGAHVMVIHHSGKDKAQGLRGHSALRAAVDTEIRLTRDDECGVITAEVTKQRDGPTGYKFSYTLRQVVLGEDQDGDQVTTCVVAEQVS
jgi:RecA-family ATPase